MAQLWDAMRVHTEKTEPQWKTDLEQFPNGRQLGLKYFSAAVIRKAIEVITD